MGEVFVPSTTHLEMNEGDIQLIKAILEMRLREDVPLKASSGISTQKCEAFNSSEKRHKLFKKL